MSKNDEIGIKKVRFRFKAILREKGDHQYYFPIKKAYIDDRYLERGKEYWIYPVLVKKDKSKE